MQLIEKIYVPPHKGTSSYLSLKCVSVIREISTFLIAQIERGNYGQSTQATRNDVPFELV